MPFGAEKLEWCGYPIFEDMFIRFDRMYERDRQTDRHIPHDSIGRAGTASRGKNRVIFLARDVMHKRSLCRRAVSVRPFVRFVDSVETNKHIFEIFHGRVSTPFLLLSTKRYGNIPKRTSNGGVECRWGIAQIAILAIGSMTDGVRTTTATVHRAIYRTNRHASVNLVYLSLQHGRREQNRTEFNCTQR